MKNPTLYAKSRLQLFHWLSMTSLFCVFCFPRSASRYAHAAGRSSMHWSGAGVRLRTEWLAGIRLIIQRLFVKCARLNRKPNSQYRFVRVKWGDLQRISCHDVVEFELSGAQPSSTVMVLFFTCITHGCPLGGSIALNRFCNDWLERVAIPPFGHMMALQARKHPTCFFFLL